MKKRIISFILTLALFVTMLQYIPTATSAGNITDDDIIDAVLVIFRCKEGTYDSVNRNDNGALSIGKLQWHGVRALELMKEIVGKDPASAQSLLGSSLYSEIVGASRDAWNSRTLSVGEAACFSALLATELSRSIQDALGRKDIANYITYARRLGIQDAAAIVYYCDLQNQYGSGGAENLLRKVKLLLGTDTVSSLDELHANLLQVTANYHSRRIWTYEYCSTLDWSNIGGGYEFSAGFTVNPNLDLQPPEITKATAFCLSAGAFQVEVEASDNKELKDCRVEVGSDVDTDASFALYGKDTDGTWITHVATDRFHKNATKYYVTITVADKSGNGTSTRLEVTQKELDEAALSSSDEAHTHRFRLLFETAPTCLTAGSRVEQCSQCRILRSTIVDPALGVTME